MNAAEGRLRILSLDAVSVPAGDAWLSPGERARLARMGSPVRRRQFLAGHWLARDLAAAALGGAPADWTWRSDDDARPRLARAGGGATWASISHCGGWIGAAVAPDAFGLDLEVPRRDRDLDALARFVLAPAERDALAALPAAGRATAFYRYWTLKEAEGKRAGQGVLPARARGLAARPAGDDEAEAWTWSLPGGGHASLAAWPGARFELDGPLDGRRGWRFEPA